MRLLRKIVIVLVLVMIALPVLILGALAYGDTRSSVSIAAFKTGYRVIPFNWSYLTLYSPLRRDVSAGYIPREVDEFLCERVATTSDLAEFDAIVHFYTIQAGGREGDCIFRTSDETREKIAARIVANFSENDLFGQIVLLEEVRLGKSLGKGKIGLGPGHPKLRRAPKNGRPGPKRPIRSPKKSTLNGGGRTPRGKRRN